jgi:hypothetical protein
MTAIVTGPKQNQIQSHKAGKVGEVKAIPGTVYLVEVQAKAGQRTVDLVFYFGDRIAFVFPKELQAALQKNMQVASDRVVDAIVKCESEEDVSQKESIITGKKRSKASNVDVL